MINIRDALIAHGVKDVAFLDWASSFGDNWQRAWLECNNIKWAHLLAHASGRFPDEKLVEAIGAAAGEKGEAASAEFMRDPDANDRLGAALAAWRAGATEDHPAVVASRADFERLFAMDGMETSEDDDAAALRRYKAAFGDNPFS